MAKVRLTIPGVDCESALPQYCGGRNCGVQTEEADSIVYWRYALRGPVAF
jgi:hypothetical protein